VDIQHRNLKTLIKNSQVLPFPRLQSGFWCLTFFVLFLLNGLSLSLSYLYVVSSVDPNSSVTTALHQSPASWLAYQLSLGVVSVFAALVDFFFLAYVFRNVRESGFIAFLTFGFACIPVWIPYVICTVLRNNAYSHICQGFDGTVLLNAAASASTAISIATFPAAFGGLTWQLFQSSPSVFQFAPSGQSPQITVNITGESYISPSNSSYFVDNPLTLPAFGLWSNGDWIRSCWAPAVTLTNLSGTPVVETGLTGINDCSQLQVCVRKLSSGADGIYVAIARILIALQSAAKCCVVRSH
jgi:hypothetical protein